MRAAGVLYCYTMKVLKRIVPFAVIVAAALLLLYSPDIAPERYTDLATFFRVEMKRQGYAGFSVAAVNDGSVLYVDGFGVDGAGKAIKSTTPLYASAASKSMAALAAYSLSLEGKLSLDAPVRDYLPWFALSAAPGVGGEVSLRHLLSHTSGVSDFDFDDAHPAAANLEAAAKSMAGAKSSAAPGARFAYIDTGYQALGRVMELAAGSDYASILEDRVFTPLGMKTASVATVRLSSPVGAASFFSLPLRRSPRVPSYADPSTHTIVSASDMGRYMAFLLGPEKYKRGPVPARAASALFDPLVSGAPYGYGLFLGRDAEGGRVAYHDGSVEGFSSRIELWPDRRSGVAVLAAQGSLLQSLFSLPALTEGARSIIRDGSAARPFPLGRLYILLAVVTAVHLFALILQTGGALQWAKEARDKAEAKGTSGPVVFASLRSWGGIALRCAIAILAPRLVGLAFGRVVTWPLLFQLEPALAVWCLGACLFGVLRNSARLAWMRGPAGFRRAR
jgi:CubicO group peptidase (beta-lactamase class C family)